MKWSASYLLFITQLFCAITALCADPALEPGEYLTNGGGGTLTITQGDKGELNFSIHAVGGNLHTCDLEGKIINGRAVVKLYEEAEESCIVLFESTSDGVIVSPQEGNGCHMFCGARASFGGEYLKLAKGCDSDSIVYSRKTFKDLYGRKAFTDAHAILANLLGNCEKAIDQFDLGWIRNDLAITQYHLGRPEECLKTLEPYADDAKLTDQQLEEEMGVAPATADAYVPIVRAARTNLKLCKQLAKRR